MKLFDILFGRTKPAPSKLEGVFAMATAYLTLQAKGNLHPDRRAALCFRPVESSYFQEAEEELREVLKIGAKEAGTRFQTLKDSYGYRWVILEDEDFEDLVTGLHLCGRTLADKGFQDQLLAAVYKFVGEGRAAYFIYNYKRGKYYPFVPKGGQERDHGLELRLRALMEKELPLEPQLEQWYPLWGLPF